MIRLIFTHDIKAALMPFGTFWQALTLWLLFMGLQIVTHHQAFIIHSLPMMGIKASCLTILVIFMIYINNIRKSGLLEQYILAPASLTSIWMVKLLAFHIVHIVPLAVLVYYSGAYTFWPILMREMMALELLLLGLILISLCTPVVLLMSLHRHGAVMQWICCLMLTVPLAWLMTRGYWFRDPLIYYLLGLPIPLWWFFSHLSARMSRKLYVLS